MMDLVCVGPYKIAYRLQRSDRRKSIGIRVLSQAEVVVYAPRDLDEARIHEIVQRKSSWIIRRFEHISAVRKAFPEREFASGEQILYLGRTLRLAVRKNNRVILNQPILDGKRLVISVGRELSGKERAEAVSYRLREWYRKNAEKVIGQRVRRYGKLLGCLPREVLVKDQKTRWGSCSAKGSIRFNWRIVMAPLSVVDYVVVHEMSHLLIKDHSKEFWRQVSLIFFDYKERREWLKEHAYWLKFSF
jgi:predicted metal-dependent hydrolase